MYRTRFAPSPTGSLHLGGARTALYNWLFAKHHHGAFILRVEDTDVERSTEAAMEQQISSLLWLGLNWDEGVRPNGQVELGALGPYRQSRRSDMYQQMAQQLLDQGLAYYCFMSDDEQEALRTDVGKTHYQVQSPYRDLPMSEAKKRIEAGEQPSIRFKVPQTSRDIFFRDLIRGDIRLTTEMLADFVIIRSNGLPVYNFCCVADDHLMHVSHVLRGEEHLSNSLKQLLIYQAFGWRAPEFGHLSIILGEDGKKLSKRNGAASLDDYHAKGILPEALINYLALLGWSHPDGEEYFDVATLTAAFSLDRVHASSAQFDWQKLLWLNSEHIKRMSIDDFLEKVKPWLKGITYPNNEWLKRALSLIQGDVKTLADIPDQLQLLLGDGPMDDACHTVMSWPSTAALLTVVNDRLSHLDGDYLEPDEFKSLLKQLKTELGVKGKELFMPLRCIFICQAQGAELAALITLVTIDQMQKNIRRLRGLV
ncbi:MAG: glutamate--tRNA ligase [Candidatus Comchoanobacterales bacterium]